MTSATDIISVLTEEHRKVEALFDQIESTTDQAERDNLLSILYWEIENHASAEETVLYPKLEALEPLRDFGDRSYAEHLEVSGRLAEAQDMSLEDDRWLETIKALHESLRRHVEHEEREVFPALGRYLNHAELQELANDYLQTKERLPLAM